MESKNAIVENADKIDTDRFRLQTAVNTQMREISGYKETIVNLQNQLKEKTENFQNQLKKETEYTKQLEEMLPKTAKKKLGIEIVEQVTKEDDSVYGAFGDHVIRQKLEVVPSKAKEILGKDIVDWIWNNYAWYNQAFNYRQ